MTKTRTIKTHMNNQWIKYLPEDRTYELCFGLCPNPISYFGRTFEDGMDLPTGKWHLPFGNYDKGVNEGAIELLPTQSTNTCPTCGAQMTSVREELNSIDVYKCGMCNEEVIIYLLGESSYGP